MAHGAWSGPRGKLRKFCVAHVYYVLYALRDFCDVVLEQPSSALCVTHALTWTIYPPARIQIKPPSLQFPAERVYN